MPDLTLKELADLTQSRLHGEPDCRISRVGSLEDAETGDLAFLGSSKFRKNLEHTRASVVILKEKDLERCPVNALVNENPYLAFAQAATRLSKRPAPMPGVHPGSLVSDSAVIAPSARIEAHCSIGAHSTIADDALIGPGCVIGENCSVGAGTRLVANVYLGDGTILGERCLIQPSAVIGADGFGMANDQGRWVKVPQLGRVVLGDDVEIGACTTVDRGAIKDTVIEDGVKLDNQIQIAHNVHVGRHTAMASGVGISGSTRIGAYCTIAGAAGMAGHLELADHTHISGLTAVTRSIREPGVYTSTVPAMPHEQWRKNFVRLKQLDDMARRIKALEKALAELDESPS